MVSFSNLDLLIILLFFLILILIGFWAARHEKDKTADSYLLSNRKVSLTFFVLTTVATWYGGILGVGEFTYRYGIVSWFTQGFPYYIFAILFAFFLSKKIREAKLYTIPDKIEEVYGKTVAQVVAILIFILVSPAPYLLMVASVLNLIFGIPLIYSLMLGLLLSTVYLFKGGYKANIYTDAFQFFVMFAGFVIIFVVALKDYGSFSFLQKSLPPEHLKLTGNVSWTYVVVWFFIALWTFVDPGFHQRCYSAKSGNIAFKGILISVALWAFFDFLTTGTGLYSAAILPNLQEPVNAFPMLAEKILSPGLKGVFYAALFATILSTLNSFLFLSATTFGNDFLFKLLSEGEEIDKNKIPVYTRIGLIVSALLATLMAYFIPSVIELWYTVGSLCIPGIIFLVIGAYYPKFTINKKTAFIEIITAVSFSFLWLLLRTIFTDVEIITLIEPMIIGLLSALIVHIFGIYKIKKEKK